MAFNDNKLGAADFSGQDISSIAGNTVVGQAAWLKARFDNVGENVIAPKFNQLIDDLQDTGAAAQIGASALTPDSGYTVGEQLQYLLDQIAGAAVGDIPDGSITDAKLSNTYGQIKSVVSDLITLKAELYSPAFTGAPTAPTPDAADDSTKIATTAFVQGELAPASAHISNSNIHVTSALKSAWNSTIRYDEAQTLTDAQKALACRNAGLSVSELLNETNITTTDKSFNVAWDDYELLMFMPGVSGNLSPGAVVPSSFVANTTSSVRINLPVMGAPDGSFLLTIQAYQNGSGKLWLKLASSTTYTPRLRIYGIIKK